jgi:Sec7-like guanine-nucleotide exchange factor
MTKDQFIKNLKGVDDKRDFPRVFLSQIYDDVAANPIEWKEDIAKARAVGMFVASITLSCVVPAPYDM